MTSSPFATFTPRHDNGREALRGPEGRPIKVLVVDDEPTLSELLGLALRYEGWDVRTAGDGATAITAAREMRPDLVVLDVMLPDMDGLEVLRRLRTDSERTPVLFLTARDAVEDRIAGLTAGGDDYVTKPFSIEELVLRLRALLRRSHTVAHRRLVAAHRRRSGSGRGLPRGPPGRGPDPTDGH